MNFSFKSFFVLLFCLFSYSFQVYSKTIVISDIDDTIKKSNSAGYGGEQIYHFLRKVPYLEMRDLFNEIKENDKGRGEAIKFYYVSAARSFTFNAQKWLQKHRFPLGRSTLKERGEKRATYEFKYAVIKNIILDEMKSLDFSSNEPFEILMFGDNAQHDAVVYSNLVSELNLNAKIYIRDVRTNATFFDSTLPVERISGVNYYFSEVELFKNAEFDYLSPSLLAKTYDSYRNQKLIPAYTLKTLNHRLDELYKDKERARSDAAKYWNDYYSRF
ncbi:MAG: hypothetical protein EHM20_12110 [Alphaproteobacteria bacterium]|nr:MAG: hypothetical protein EHM20_12110 [Alphaproteobacteria bacterium]